VPFFVNTAAQPWERPAGAVRRAGVSSFGFGGTNFHVVVEEHVPGLLTRARKSFPGAEVAHAAAQAAPQGAVPLRGMAVLGASDLAGLSARLTTLLAEARAGRAPSPALPAAQDLAAAERLVIDYGSATELLERGEKAAQALAADEPRAWRALRGRGIFRGSGPAPKIAFLFPGQGSQYLGMLKKLRETVPVVRDTFDEADKVMADLAAAGVDFDDVTATLEREGVQSFAGSFNDALATLEKRRAEVT
jgi:acyl transferase domain-containing protein